MVKLLVSSSATTVVSLVFLVAVISINICIIRYLLEFSGSNPALFSIIISAHLNHLLEFYYQRNYSLQRTFMAVGIYFFLILLEYIISKLWKYLSTNICIIQTFVILTADTSICPQHYFVTDTSIFVKVSCNHMNLKLKSDHDRILGTQLAYTMIFGSYASFLFIRTGMSCLLVFRWDFVSFFQPCLFSCLRSRKVAFSAKLLVLHLFVLELLFMNFEFTTKVVLSTTASDEFTGNIRGITQPYP